jgi:methylated-DNA-[protein]-cysteine S-methyltransferase
MKQTDPDWQAIVETPLGPLGVRVDAKGLAEIDFLPNDRRAQSAADPLSRKVVGQLARYFLQPAPPFSLPLHLQGTPFQRSVWGLLCEIPVGQVWTYGEMARRLGSSPRAVGNACRRNPVPVVVPCHRVVGAQGLGGYAGETTGRNMEIKRWLLAHEGVELPA